MKTILTILVVALALMGVWYFFIRKTTSSDQPAKSPAPAENKAPENAPKPTNIVVLTAPNPFHFGV